MAAENAALKAHWQETMTDDDWADLIAQGQASYDRANAAEGGEEVGASSPIAEALKEGKEPQANEMTAQDFRAALAKLDLSITNAAPLLGVSVRQAMRYAQGVSPISPTMRKLIRAVESGDISLKLLDRL